MAGISYDGQQEFARGIIEGTLNNLRDQEDAAQDLTLRGTAEFNTGVFDTARSGLQAETWTEGRHYLYGTVTFTAGFKGLPQVTFGQESIRTYTSSTPRQESYTPFLVQPYVYSWVTTNDLVGGFVLGLYALTVPPGRPQQHRVFWQAAGASSRYREVESDEAWTEDYDQNDADYLEESVDAEYDSTDAPEYAAGEEDQ